MNTKKADFDVDAYVKTVLEKSAVKATEGKIEGKLTTKETVVKEFSYLANSWVEHGSNRLLLMFGVHPGYFNFEVSLSSLGSENSKLAIPPDFVKVAIINGEGWDADTANLSNLSFDQTAKKLSGKLYATVFRNTSAGQETGTLQADFNISVA